jgi:hypothetical protein
MPIRIRNTTLFAVLRRLTDQIELERFKIVVFDGADSFVTEIITQGAPIAWEEDWARIPATFLSPTNSASIILASR